MNLLLTLGALLALGVCGKCRKRLIIKLNKFTLIDRDEFFQLYK